MVIVGLLTFWHVTPFKRCTLALYLSQFARQFTKVFFEFGIIKECISQSL